MREKVLSGGIGIVGLKTNNPRLVDLAFDVLSLEALFMVPRVFSILSLSPYWGVSRASACPALLARAH